MGDYKFCNKEYNKTLSERYKYYKRFGDMLSIYDIAIIASDEYEKKYNEKITYSKNDLANVIEIHFIAYLFKELEDGNFEDEKSTNKFFESAKLLKESYSPFEVYRVFLSLDDKLFDEKLIAKIKSKLGYQVVEIKNDFNKKDKNKIYIREYLKLVRKVFDDSFIDGSQNKVTNILRLQYLENVYTHNFTENIIAQNISEDNNLWDKVFLYSHIYSPLYALTLVNSLINSNSKNETDILTELTKLEYYLFPFLFEYVYARLNRATMNDLEIMVSESYLNQKNKFYEYFPFHKQVINYKDLEYFKVFNKGCEAVSNIDFGKFDIIKDFKIEYENKNNHCAQDIILEVLKVLRKVYGLNCMRFSEKILQSNISQFILEYLKNNNPKYEIKYWVHFLNLLETNDNIDLSEIKKLSYLEMASDYLSNLNPEDEFTIEIKNKFTPEELKETIDGNKLKERRLHYFLKNNNYFPFWINSKHKLTDLIDIEVFFLALNYKNNFKKKDLVNGKYRKQKNAIKIDKIFRKYAKLCQIDDISVLIIEYFYTSNYRKLFVDKKIEKYDEWYHKNSVFTLVSNEIDKVFCQLKAEEKKKFYECTCEKYQAENHKRFFNEKDLPNLFL